MRAIFIYLRFTFLTLALLLSLQTSTLYAGRSETAGDVTLALLAGAAGGVTLLNSDMVGGIQLSKAALTDLGVTYTLKHFVHARRPDGSDNESFPSAHSSVAFTSAEYLRKRYGLEYGLPAYAAAVFVGWSRVDADKHYTRDVLAGAAIGIASSWFFTTPSGRTPISAEVAPGYVGAKYSNVW